MDVQSKKVSIPLIIGIVCIPLFFAWFTLRNGYSKKARIVSFGYLIFTFILFASLPSNVQQKRAMEDTPPQAIQAEESEPKKAIASEPQAVVKKPEPVVAEPKTKVEGQPTTVASEPKMVDKNQPTQNLTEQEKLRNEIKESMRLHASTPNANSNEKYSKVNIHDDKAILKMVGLPVVDKEKGTDEKDSPMTTYWFHKDLRNNLEIDLSKNMVKVWWQFNENDPKKVTEMFSLAKKVTNSLLGNVDGSKFYSDLTRLQNIEQVKLSNGITVKDAHCFNNLCRYEIVRN